MFYFFIFISLLLMSNQIRSNILWNYTKLMTKIELWTKKKENNDLIIQNIYEVNGYKMGSLKNKLIKNKNYIFHDGKISFKNINEYQKLLVKYKFKNNNFRIILPYTQLKDFIFDFTNIEEPKFLSITNDNDQDITQIINEYSGPLRNFYKDKVEFLLQNIYLDSDLKLGNEDKFKIVNNMADEIEINNIKEFIELI